MQIQLKFHKYTNGDYLRAVNVCVAGDYIKFKKMPKKKKKVTKIFGETDRCMQI